MFGDHGVSKEWNGKTIGHDKAVDSLAVYQKIRPNPTLTLSQPNPPSRPNTPPNLTSHDRHNCQMHTFIIHLAQEKSSRNGKLTVASTSAFFHHVTSVLFRPNHVNCALVVWAPFGLCSHSSISLATKRSHSRLPSSCAISALLLRSSRWRDRSPSRKFVI